MRLSSAIRNANCKITDLYLHNKNLSQFKFDCEVECLEYLELSSNKLTEFSFERSPKSLKFVYLCFNKISKIYWNVCCNVKTLSLRFNGLTEFDWNFVPSSLEDLNLSGNAISNFNFKNCPRNLKHLTINHNIDINWEYCPWELEIHSEYHILSNSFENYKKSRNGVPHLPHIPDIQKNLMKDLINLSYIPNNRIYSKLFKNGGIMYREIKDLLDKS